MSQNHASEQKSWWNLVLTGVLAIAFGVAAIMLPGRIMFGRILDVIFGQAKPLSGSMTAVAIFLALIALVAIDGLINLVGPTTKGKTGQPASWRARNCSRGRSGLVARKDGVRCSRTDRSVGRLDWSVPRNRW